MSTKASLSRDRTPWLMVWKNRIVHGSWSQGVDEPLDIRAVVLRGLNLSGMQHREFQYVPGLSWRESAGITYPVIREIHDQWNANLIRLPVNQDWFLNGLGAAGKSAQQTRKEYREDIRQIVDWCASFGIYTLLSLHTLYVYSETDLAGNRVRKLYNAPMPDDRSLDFWQEAAAMFRNDPAVLFDIFNEPHIPLSPPYEPAYRGITPGRGKGWVSVWHDWARKIEAVVHGVHPDAVIFVSGIGGTNWALSLRSMPVPVLSHGMDSGEHVYLPNTVYASHVYCHRARRLQIDQVDGKTFLRGTRRGADFGYWFGMARLRRHHPIFVSEWGCCTEQNCPHEDCIETVEKSCKDNCRRWLGRLEAYMQALHSYDKHGRWQGLAGWAAWSRGDHPHLVVDDGEGGEQLTEFGGDVKNWLQRPAYAGYPF